MDVFLVNNFNSLKLSEEIAVKDCRNILIVLSGDLVSETDNSVWEEVIILPKKFSLEYLLRYRNIYLRLLRKGEKLNYLYVPNIDNPLCNTLVFSKRFKGIYCLCEGTLNYTNYTLKDVKLRLLVKKMAFLLMGMQYKIQLGHFSGLDLDEINGVYTHKVEGIYSFGKEINRVRSSYKSNVKFVGNNILVIGQYLSEFINGEVVDRIYSCISLFIEENQNHNTKVFYKPHPRLSCPHEKQSVVNLIKIGEMEPVEDLIEVYDIGIVVSVCSSSLINIKVNYPKVRVIAFGVSDVIKNSKRFIGIDNLLFTSGIEIK
jgi:hypothetical protein